MDAMTIIIAIAIIGVAFMLHPQIGAALAALAALFFFLPSIAMGLLAIAVIAGLGMLMAGG